MDFGFWILFSRFTCAKNELFNRYKSYNVGGVVIANGLSNKIIGMCTVKMKLFDGVVWMLGDVRHVSSFRKNLVSLNMLNTLDYSFYAMNKFMKVGKSLLVIIKVKKRDNLYKLIGILFELKLQSMLMAR